MNILVCLTTFLISGEFYDFYEKYTMFINTWIVNLSKSLI